MLIFFIGSKKMQFLFSQKKHPKSLTCYGKILQINLTTNQIDKWKMLNLHDIYSLIETYEKSYFVKLTCYFSTKVCLYPLVVVVVFVLLLFLLYRLR